MTQEEILKLIEKISPHAKDYVYNSFENVEILYYIFTLHNKGVFIKVDNEDCCIFYASFVNDDSIEDVLELIKYKTNEYISKMNSKELCFNVNGNNSKIINLVRELGFKLDMEGYHLEYRGKEFPQLKNSDLTDKGFENSMLKELVDLFDSAYHKLNIDNGWETKSHAVNEEQFHQELNTLNKLNQFCSFWLNDELIGAYIFQQNYITDIVVRPIYQNNGYGNYILAHCIRNMNVYKSINNIRLRVAKSNIGAKKLYERNGFIEIACFAEHTYK
ncbi:GNAT family N-acetyltransferase [Clostridium sp. YIM B02515]|uniref:GNAT family N-acetyltransferase n=1 Tax=Clostridium rhizosphaerae TaxID=2803861 RepID=A0ABS1T6U8_9CLOT|nr:GNAT family N-acetyltransferase [Clostridium rhizosphaerae]MBL4935073.1 GNAT family N-acetyltransferase [Clostridium rhizosphaerae]